VISHVTLEIDKDLLGPELRFWRLLGYDRMQRTRAMGQTEWLRSWPGLAAEGWASSWIHLVPVERSSLPVAVIGEGESRAELVGGRAHPAVVVGSRFNEVLRLLLRGGTPVHLYPEHWGRRAMTRSPSGWRVEVLEAHPLAKWPAAPRDD